MSEILGAPDVFLAGDDTLQRQNANFSAEPIQYFRALIFVVEGFEALT